jgi:hypothetical protein
MKSSLDNLEVNSEPRIKKSIVGYQLICTKVNVGVSVDAISRSEITRIMIGSVKLHLHYCAILLILELDLRQYHGQFLLRRFVLEIPSYALIIILFFIIIKIK